MSSYGQLCCERRRAGPRENVVWLAERAERWGGAWGLGCTICAFFVNRAADAQPQRGQQVRRCRSGTRFSRFEVRYHSLQVECVKQHAVSAVHRKAVAAWLNPDEPLRFASQATLQDEQLLSGAVPQPPDWLRTWRAAITPQSWQSASKNLQTEHYMHMLRPRAVQARALQRMARIQAEVIRDSFREWLREATSIILLFDDRHGYKMVLFRCAAPLATAQGTEDGTTAQGTQDGIAARSGLLGINEMLTGVTFEELAADYAERVVEDIRLMCARFCTPLGDVRDDALMKRLVGQDSIVKHLVVDGALRKSCEFLKSSLFPNAVLLIRDPTHFVRTAVKVPLEETGNFAEQHAALFGDRHALPASRPARPSS